MALWKVQLGKHGQQESVALEQNVAHGLGPLPGVLQPRIAHQGYRTQGRTPYQAFLDGIEAMRREEVKPEAALS